MKRKLLFILVSVLLLALSAGATKRTVQTATFSVECDSLLSALNAVIIEDDDAIT